MRRKRKIALLLAAIMLLTTAPALKPTEVQAANGLSYSQYQLTVPSNIKFTATGWNTIGTVNVKGGYDASNASYFPVGSKIQLTITTTNSYKLKSASGSTIPYSLSWTSALYSRDEVTREGGVSSTLQAYINASNYNSAPDGTYTDTIKYTAKRQVETVSMENASRKTITTDLLGSPTTFTHDGTTYIAYNRFVGYTTGSNWQNAKDFVAQLNANNFDGHSDWSLLTDVDFAFNWWLASGKPSKYGDVKRLWQNAGKEDYGYYFDIETAATLNALGKFDYEVKNKSFGVIAGANSGDKYGFVVIRPA